MRRHSFAFVVTLLLLAPAALGAQAGADSAQSRPDTARRAAAAAAPSFDFSGVLYANYQYGGAKGDRAQNRFELDRAYLTFRAKAGERTSVRLTADVFQQTSSGADAYYRGWAVRMKYAYGQYQFLQGADGLKADVRLGMVHNPIIEVIEQHWIRGIAQTAIDATGFFSSADVGVASNVTLPGRLGEAYVGVFNGNGYQSRETDRFKDYGARLTLTPFANGSSVLKGFSVSPWYYKGATASRYLAGPGTLEPVRASRQKDRYGVFLAVKDPRLTLGLGLARRVDDTESADTLADVEPTVAERSNDLTSAFVVARPLALLGGPADSRLLVAARTDRRPVRDADAYSDFHVLGLGWDLSAKTQLWLDWQSGAPRYAGAPASADTRTWYLHLIANY